MLYIETSMVKEPTDASFLKPEVWEDLDVCFKG